MDMLRADKPVRPAVGKQADLTPPSTRSTSPTTRKPAEPSTMSAQATHAEAVSKAWERLQNLLGGDSVVIDGKSLDIPSLVAVARHGSKAELSKSQEVLKRIQDSIDFLEASLERGEMIYGVNTGFGGSADTRTSDLVSLQRALVQHQGSGVLTSWDIGRPIHDGMSAPNELGPHSMPTSWVRGTMLTRVNSIIRGHSAVTLEVINGILTLLDKNFTPVIPLRSSISASGDLSPLSYIAGAIEGNPDIFIRTGADHDFKIIPAPEALQLAGLQPVKFAAKEGLGLLNGTAVSASAASLALHETNHLAILSQTLTAMGVEALAGTAESFHPFIAAIRPHRGQKEVAANIMGFLSGSRIARAAEGEAASIHEAGLAQDRYALRTSSQWIGPQLEDLLLASEQITIELNSTTDNPLIDVVGGVVHHGGNFQAAAITSAMEKSRLALQMLGKLLFAQVTEMINASMNKGLPANLAADDPSLSFTCKGIDIAMAAYMSELAFLANPVSSHVQSAEMHNQAVNSLALISARYTFQAVELLSLMCASYLFAVCQALDLRVLQNRFYEAAKEKLKEFTSITSGFATDEYPLSSDDQDKLVHSVWTKVKSSWESTNTKDLSVRCKEATEVATTEILTSMLSLENLSSAHLSLHRIGARRAALQSTLQELYDSKRLEMFQNHKTITPTYLGSASAKLYRYVRERLDVPFHRGLVEHPLQPVKEGQSSRSPEQRRTIGHDVSVIYEAIRNGEIYKVIVDVVRSNARSNGVGNKEGPQSGRGVAPEPVQEEPETINGGQFL